MLLLPLWWWWWWWWNVGSDRHRAAIQVHWSCSRCDQGAPRTTTGQWVSNTPRCSSQRDPCRPWTDWLRCLFADGSRPHILLLVLLLLQCAGGNDDDDSDGGCWCWSVRRRLHRDDASRPLLDVDQRCVRPWHVTKMSSCTGYGRFARWSSMSTLSAAVDVDDDHVTWPLPEDNVRNLIWFSRS